MIITILLYFIAFVINSIKLVKIRVIYSIIPGIFFITIVFLGFNYFLVIVWFDLFVFCSL